MRKLSITFGTILLVLGCFAFSPAATADNGPIPIAGFWHTTYISDFTGPAFQGYQQWHSDGLEWESANAFPGAMCLGTFIPTGPRSIRLFHVGWFPGGGPNGSVRFVLTEPDTVVSLDGNSFEGRYDQKFFDANGKLVLEDKGKVQGTRLTVH
jgi:hypothetical protein